MKKIITSITGLGILLSNIGLQPVIAEAESILPPTVLASPSVIRIKSGQTLLSISRELGISMSELRSLNPELDLKDLKAGSSVRVRRTNPGEPLDIRSINLQPDTPQKQYILDQIERNNNNEMNRREQETQRAMAGWKKYGSYYYNWRDWKLSPNGTRTTERTISKREVVREHRIDVLREDIAVTCKGLKITKLAYDGWGKWNNPDPGETEMMMALCGNIPGAPKAAVRTKVLPPPPITKRDSESCTGSRIECATEDVTASDIGRSSNPFSYSLPNPQSKCGGNLVCNVLDVFF